MPCTPLACWSPLHVVAHLSPLTACGAVMCQARIHSRQEGQVYTHTDRGTAQLSLDLTPQSQELIPAGKGSGHDKTRLDISHRQFPESAPQYLVSRLHHQVWGQRAAALPTWLCPLRTGGWQEGSREQGNVRLWRERAGRQLDGEESSLKPASQCSDPTPKHRELYPRPPPRSCL